MLLAPAFWNGYPLLQWDTGGYLARWYEGYLVPSRSTTFGIYLHFGEDSSFWINLGIQALATLWILQLTLRVMGLAAAAIGSSAIEPGADHTHRAAVACQHTFDGHFYGSVGAVALHPNSAWRQDINSGKMPVVRLDGLRGGLSQRHLGACWSDYAAIGWIARRLLRGRISVSGLTQGSLTIVAGAALLVSTNFALSGQLAWTPGGYSMAFRADAAGWHRRSLSA